MTTPCLSISIFLLVLYFSPAVYAGNTTCLSDALDWYTDAVGETPCTTYQRLRQICNSDYQLGSFRPTTPGDNCDDQVADCCCSSISWGLSMLCMNCQQDSSTMVNGIDAGKGGYQTYTSNSHCVNPTNSSLSPSIQAAVCNTGLRLDDFLYDSFWSDGSWFYTWTREQAETNQAANANNTFTHCANQVISSSQPASTGSSTASSSFEAYPTASNGQTTADPQAMASPNSGSSLTSAVPVVIHSSSISASTSSSILASASQEVAPISASASHTRTGLKAGVVGGVIGFLLVFLLGIFGLRMHCDRALAVSAGVAPFEEEPRESRSFMRGPRESGSRVLSIAPRSDFATYNPAVEMSYFPSDALKTSPKSQFVPDLVSESPLQAPMHTLSRSNTLLSNATSDASAPTTSTDVLLREQYSGPVVEFVRSTSGRLPPAYSQLLRESRQPVQCPGYV